MFGRKEAAVIANDKMKQFVYSCIILLSLHYISAEDSSAQTWQLASEADKVFQLDDSAEYDADNIGDSEHHEPNEAQPDGFEACGELAVKNNVFT